MQNSMIISIYISCYESRPLRSVQIYSYRQWQDQRQFWEVNCRLGWSVHPTTQEGLRGPTMQICDLKVSESHLKIPSVMSYEINGTIIPKINPWNHYWLMLYGLTARLGVHNTGRQSLLWNLKEDSTGTIRHIYVWVHKYSCFILKSILAVISKQF